MITYKKQYQIEPQWQDKEWILRKAEEALQAPVRHITDVSSERSQGGIHDYYSNGDYWWPNPDTPDGLPYVQRDGETNPDNFNEHRMIMRHMRSAVVYLASAYRLTGEEKYAERAAVHLKEFFLDEETCMAPNLSYAQALLGICPGRGVGIIDTLHLVDVVFAVESLKESKAVSDEIYRGVKAWFAKYLGWMLTDPNGIDEMTMDNNHGVCFFVQVAAFALFTDNETIAEFCREHFKKVLLKQEADDGSFPRETGRTKPYNYSIFVVDNMVNLCQLLSKPEDNLWEYVSEDGKSIRKALDFITPYVLDKKSWPYPPDVMHFDAFPARAGFMMMAGCVLGKEELLELYRSLPVESKDEEARRNIAVRQPMLWM
ncbi:MAG: alginate lyase family protein [Lachnospiraceae bacterium]|nr:alginate lyase family protein [Lachnospiraceae bacterium]